MEGLEKSVRRNVEIFHHLLNMRYLTHNQIDKDKWNDCIARSCNAMIYGYSWYLDVVCPGWEALTDDDYKAVMPLTCKKKYTLNYLYQPFFMQQGGIFSSKALTEKEIESFLSAIPAKFRYVDFNVNEAHATFNHRGFNFRQRRNILLDLNFPYHQLQKNFSENCKRNIKKAEKAGLSLKEGNAETVIELFKNNRGLQYQNIKPENYDRLINLTRTLRQHQSLKILEVIKNNSPIAGAIFTLDKKRITFLFSGMNNAFKEDRPMFFLINEVIKSNSEKPLIFDFEGSDNDELARFYKGFGGREVFYLHVKRNTLPYPVRLFKK